MTEDADFIRAILATPADDTGESPKFTARIGRVVVKRG